MKRLDTPSQKNITLLLEKTEELVVSKKTLPPTSYKRIQDAIDIIDDQLDEPDYKLYEAQALLHFANNDIENALGFIEDALVIEDNPKKYTKTANMLIKQYYDKDALQENDNSDEYNIVPLYKEPTSTIDNTVDTKTEEETVKDTKYSGKFHGWLALYTLRIIAIPLVLMYDLSSFVTDDIFGYSSEIMSYLAFVGVMDVILLIAAIGALYLYFKKKKLAINIKYLEGMLFIYQLIAGVWLYFLSQSYDTETNPEAIKLFVQSIITFLWMLYWIYSKRVKATFIK